MNARDPWDRPRPARRTAVAAAVVAAALVAGAALALAALGGQEAYRAPEGLQSADAVRVLDDDAAPEAEALEPRDGADGAPEAEAECAHAWETDYVPAEPVEHEAVTEAALVYHTICNVCGETVDGRAGQHSAETGHKGSTPNVPVPEEVVVEEAWTEEPEPGELVPAGTETCRLCGETREEES